MLSVSGYLPAPASMGQTLPLIATAALRVKSCGEAVRCDENVRRYLIEFAARGTAERAISYRYITSQAWWSPVLHIQTAS